MHCPWCGDQMTERDGALVCSAAAVDVSIKASQALRELVADAPDRSAVGPATIRRASSWHCPADGVPMIAVDGVIMCPECGRVLPGRLWYQLLEFNFHPDSPA